MFKKSLVALAITSISVGAFAASDIATNTVERVVSIEGAATLTNANTDLVQVVLGAEYTVGDIMTFDVTGADLDPTTAPASIAAALADANDTMTLGLLDATASKLTYRVTELTYDGLLGETTIAATVSFPADTLGFVAADILASGAVSITYSAATSTGIALDTAAGTDGTASLFVTGTQFSSVTTTPFSAVIDVNQARLGFTGPATVDSLLITPSNDSVNVLFDATPTGVTYTITGDFSILDDDPDTAGVQLQANAVTVAGGGSVTSIDETTLVVDHAGFAAQTITIDVDADIAGASGQSYSPLSTQSFSVDVDVAYTDHGTNGDPTIVAGAVAGSTMTQTASAAGSWTLNGSSDDIAFLPFGSEYAQSITVTNTGTLDGGITVDLTAGGMTYTKTLTAIAAAKTVTNIGKEVAAFAAESGISGDARVKVVVNAAQANIAVKGVYYHKASQDRVLTY